MIELSRPLRVRPVGQPGRDGPVERAARLPPAVRAVHRAVLRAFLSTGAAPHPNNLPASEGVEFDEALRQLREVDLIHLGTGGGIAVAYPFCGHPTGFLVQLDDGPRLYAMCAIDALGIPLMTGRDTVITAADPGTGSPIRVHYSSAQWRWSPAGAAVLLAHTDQGGSAATCQCPVITFHTSQTAAAQHLSARRELAGDVLDQATAVQVARLTFGDLLDEPDPPTAPATLGLA